jgi:hypothetical protein
MTEAVIRKGINRQIKRVELGVQRQRICRQLDCVAKDIAESKKIAIPGYYIVIGMPRQAAK